MTAVTDFFERQVWLTRNEIQQPRLMLLQRGAAVALRRFYLDAAGPSPLLRPADRGRWRDIHQPRRLARAVGIVSESERAQAKIRRVSLAHPMSPTLAVAKTEADLRAAWNPPVTNPIHIR